MTKKESLFYLVQRYCVGEYEIPTFCDAFFEIYYPDRPIDELTESEFGIFEKMAKTVDRFSEFESDHKMCPNAFSTEEEVDAAIREAAKELERESPDYMDYIKRGSKCKRR